VTSDRALKVFVSYSRKDEEFARELVIGLQFGGFEPYLDRHDISAGEDWEARLGRLIEAADTVVFIITPDAVESKRCAWEVECALAVRKRVLPIVWRNVEEARVPAALKRLNYIYFDKPHSFAPSLATLASALTTDLDWVREHTRLAELALRWDARGRAPALLIRAEELVAAKEWLARQPAHALEPALVTHEFLKASEEAELARANSERQQLEAMAAAQETRAKALAAAEAAQKARALAQRRNALLIVLAGVLALAFLGAAIWQSRETQKREAIMLTGLAHSALQEEQYDRAMRIALQGLPPPGASPLELGWSDAEARGLAAKLANAAAVSHLQLALIGHAGAVRMALFNRDGSRILTASADGTARIWDTATGRTISVLTGHKGAIRSIAYDPDETRIVTASEDGSARVWDAASGRETAVLQGHKDQVRHAAFSPDGGMIATASFDRTVRLWDARTGTETGALIGHERAVYKARFSRDGKLLATASHDGTARLWQVESRQQIAVLKHSSPVFDIAFSPDGKHIATAANFETVIWDVSGEKIFDLGDRSDTDEIVWSPDSSRVVGVMISGGLKVWDAATGKQLTEFKQHFDRPTSAAFSPDSKLVLSTSLDQTARLWDAATGAELARFVGHGGAVVHGAFDANGAKVVTASADGTARIWGLSYLRASLDLKTQDPTISDLLIPDGAHLVSVSPGPILQVRDVTGARRGAAIKAPTDTNRWSSVAVVALDRDASRMLVAFPFVAQATLWDTASGAAAAVLKGHKGSIRAAAFSLDGSRLATASEDHNVILWEVPSGKPLKVMRGHNAVVGAVAFSPDGKTIASGAVDRTLRLWDVATGNAEKTIAAHADWVESIDFSRDGKLILTASRDHTARLWDAASGSLILTFKGNKREIRHARFSPDGAHIMTDSADGSLRLWDASTGNELASLPLASDAAWQAAFSVDGTKILIAGGSQMREWDVSLAMRQPADLRNAICRGSSNGARSFTALDTDNPILHGLEGTDPCERRGLLNATYWVRLVGQPWGRFVRNQ
jgi:WD40 repeat protein